MPAAVLAGGASRRMGRSKAALPYGAATLLEFQTTRLAELFEEVLVVAKEPPGLPGRPGPRRARRRAGARRDPRARPGARGSRRTGSSCWRWTCRRFPTALMRAIARRGPRVATPRRVVPRADGRLQPLAAVWRRAVLAGGARGASRAGELSLHGLAEEVGAEILEETRVAGVRSLRQRLREPEHARAVRGAAGEGVSA